MKATGIVRRIDDLGRVVIPKEIRRTLRIREGDPLEIYTEASGEVIFKKYSPVGELSPFAEHYVQAVCQETRLAVLICDRDHCIAASGVSKKDYIEHRITDELEKVMEGRRAVVTKENEKAWYAVEGGIRAVRVAVPILSSGDIVGAVVLVDAEGSEQAEDSDIKLALVAAGFLGRILE